MRFLVFLIFAILAVSCSKSDDEVFDELVLHDLRQPNQIIDSLNSAYINNSVSDLKSLLNYWNSEVQPKITSEISEEDELNIYQIFIEIYNPFNIDILGNHEWGSGMYEGLEYIIVQNKVYYDFNFNNDIISEADSVTDFRPDVTFRNVKTLFLTDNYNNAINTFLGSDFNQTITTGFSAPYVPVAESYERSEFLNQELVIIPGHWGNYWNIETHPYISLIRFNSNKEKALVNFRIGYMFGEAIMQKSEDRWQLVSSSINAIE
jgi:hypothetical protein